MKCVVIVDIFMQTIKDLARNSGFLFLNGIATNILSFFALLYIARYLGPEKYGIYSFVFAFIYFFSFIPDMGVHQILVREAAKEPEKAGKLIGNGTIIQVCPFACCTIFSCRSYKCHKFSPIHEKCIIHSVSRAAYKRNWSLRDYI